MSNEFANVDSKKGWNTILEDDNRGEKERYENLLKTKKKNCYSFQFKYTLFIVGCRRPTFNEINKILNRILIGVNKENPPLVKILLLQKWRLR